MIASEGLGLLCLLSSEFAGIGALRAPCVRSALWTLFAVLVWGPPAVVPLWMASRVPTHPVERTLSAYQRISGDQQVGAEALLRADPVGECRQESVQLAFSSGRKSITSLTGAKNISGKAWDNLPGPVSTAVSSSR